jgi:rSAM/selenodomain-associated transferase 2
MISVIIPTLNAQSSLDATLDPLSYGKPDLIQEIIICDGGSQDGTIEIAIRANCRVVRCTPGRGEQLRYGASHAKGRWLLFLHADTRLSIGWEAAVKDFLGRVAASQCAAVFTFKLDDHTKRAWLLERIVDLRVKVFGLPYGDQGLLISRSFYDDVGGFKPLPLMEDVDLIRRIGHARIETLAVSAATSADRYKRNGYLFRTTRNFLCLLLYFVGVPPRLIARLYG